VTDDELLNAFESLTLPFSDWTHRAHVRAAFIFLQKLPFERALERMRAGIKAYNARHAVPETETSGYNETTTCAFVHLVAATRQAYAGTHPAADSESFCETHPQLMTRHALRLFYSPQRRMDPRAKTRFLEPDLAPLPIILPDPGLGPGPTPTEGGTIPTGQGS
jgi:hypothetical protein